MLYTEEKNNYPIVKGEIDEKLVLNSCKLRLDILEAIVGSKIKKNAINYELELLFMRVLALSNMNGDGDSTVEKIYEGTKICILFNKIKEVLNLIIMALNCDSQTGRVSCIVKLLKEKLKSKEKKFKLVESIESSKLVLAKLRDKISEIKTKLSNTDLAKNEERKIKTEYYRYKKEFDERTKEASISVQSMKECQNSLFKYEEEQALQDFHVILNIP
ncbi:MAG: hypothetical protein MHPSP_001430 [Paramarteilia canceri]